MIEIIIPPAFLQLAKIEADEEAKGATPLPEYPPRLFNSYTANIEISLHIASYIASEYAGVATIIIMLAISCMHACTYMIRSPK